MRKTNRIARPQRKDRMEEETKELLIRFYQDDHRIDEIYHSYSRYFSMPDTRSRILYCLHESSSPWTQAALAEWIFSPMQTVNSALKKMEQEGILTLNPLPDNRKNKQICLTEAGKVLAERVAVPLKRAEDLAFDGLTIEEQRQMVGLLRKYTGFLKARINEITNCRENRRKNNEDQTI